MQDAPESTPMTTSCAVGLLHNCSQVRCLDMSADRTKLALVDEQSHLAVYDIATKVSEQGHYLLSYATCPWQPRYIMQPEFHSHADGGGDSTCTSRTHLLWLVIFASIAITSRTSGGVVRSQGSQLRGLEC